MKDYRRLLAQYDPAATLFLEHEWGQNAAGLYNRVAKALNAAPPGHRAVVTSYKKFGIKGIVAFMEERGISCSIVGKGPDDLRLVECVKNSDDQLPLISTEQPVSFAFQGKDYAANAGDAIFSKAGLDAGTRALLDSFLAAKPQLSGKAVADFGSGWGAISIVLADRFPEAGVTAYEKDEASFEASERNLRAYPNADAVHLDLTKPDTGFIKTSQRFDYILSNPPFHAKTEEKDSFFLTAHRLLKPRGELWLVIEKSFMPRFRRALSELFVLSEEKKEGEYVVGRYRKLT